MKIINKKYDSKFYFFISHCVTVFCLFVGRLTLSIPWKNLYNESTVVVIQDLHVLARPNFGML